MAAGNGGARRRVRDAILAASMAALLAQIPAAPSAAELPMPAADGQPFDAQTKAALQEVISNQLKAFEKGDAEAAEAFAAPAIRERFPEPSAFLAMVRKDYGALIHPRSTQFTGTADSPHGPLQKVTVVAADGTVWSAIYSFEKVEGKWRITGCGLAEDKSQQEI